MPLERMCIRLNATYNVNTTKTHARGVSEGKKTKTHEARWQRKRKEIGGHKVFKRTFARGTLGLESARATKGLHQGMDMDAPSNGHASMRRQWLCGTRAGNGAKSGGTL